MLEPSDLITAVNRLLVGLGQILTAAVLLAVVALLAAQAGNVLARNAAVLALGFTTVGYALQLARMTPIRHGLMVGSIWASWVGGALAVMFLLFAGK